MPINNGARAASDPRASGLLKNQSGVIPNRRNQLSISHVSEPSESGAENQFQ